MRQAETLRNLTSLVWTFALLIIAPACYRNRTVAVGDRVSADLVVLFKQGTDGAAINDFLTKTLPSSRSPSGEYAPVLQSELGVSVHGYTGYALTFQENASPGVRADVERRIRASSIVYRVFRNRAPNSIKAAEVSSAA